MISRMLYSKHADANSHIIYSCGIGAYKLLVVLNQCMLIWLLSWHRELGRLILKEKKHPNSLRFQLPIRPFHTWTGLGIYMVHHQCSLVQVMPLGRRLAMRARSSSN